MASVKTWNASASVVVSCDYNTVSRHKELHWQRPQWKHTLLFLLFRLRTEQLRFPSSGQGWDRLVRMSLSNQIQRGWHSRGLSSVRGFCMFCCLLGKERDFLQKRVDTVSTKEVSDIWDFTSALWPTAEQLSFARAPASVLLTQGKLMTIYA